jgi:poly-gamma-glutamate capsule biosynthesis protein CapA/YwtB (metallophosphatase superfamily)
VTPPTQSTTRGAQARRRSAARRRQIRRRRAVAFGVIALAIGVPTTLAITGGGSSSASGTSERAEQTAQTTAAVPLNRSIRLAAVGDIVMGSLPYGLPSDGGRSLFTAVKPLLRGDVVLGNLEGTLATGGSSKCGPKPGPNCFAFRTPPSYARWLKDAGFTVMTVANNHADDFGATGRRQTRENLARVGVRGTGWPGSIAYLKVAGSEIAVVGFAPNDVSNSMLDIAGARILVARAAARAPVVIVTVHAGAEGAGADRVRPGTETFLGENRGDSVRFAHAVVDAGADVVVGHGPHVMRGIEFYKGRLIAYSMGNFMGYAVFSLRGNKSQSAVLDLELGVTGKFLRGSLRPVTLVGKGVPTPGGTMVTRMRRLSKLDFGARAAKLGADGSITPPA